MNLIDAIQLAENLAKKENQNYYVIKLNCGRLDLINEQNFRKQNRTKYLHKTNIQ